MGLSDLFNPNFDAGELGTDESEAENDARADYEAQVGSDEHASAIDAAREASGLDVQSPSDEE